MARVLADKATLRAEAKRLIRELAGRRDYPGETAEQAMRRVGRLLTGWSYNRIKDIWVGKPRVQVRAEEIEQLRTCLGVERIAGVALGELQNKIASLEARLERISAYLSRVDDNPRWNSVRELVRDSRNENCTLD